VARRAALVAIATAALATAAAAQARAPRDVIRVGGPSAPSESKVAIVGSERQLAGARFRVIDLSGDVVFKGRLRPAAGKPAPFEHAYRADWSAVTTPGSYHLAVGRLSSSRWQVSDSGGRLAIAAILGFFDANRDGAEPSYTHGPAHLNDAVIHPDAPAHGGVKVDLTGGWMDAGDMIHFTQTTAFSAAVLEASARLDPADAAALTSEADVGVRWLLKAHPFPDAFIAQVGDERDHETGFRDPAADDGSSKPGIGTRFAYTLPPDRIGGDLGGKTAAALAMAYQRTGSPAQLAAAREWYDAGALSARSAPALRSAGYPGYAANFYHATHWQDSMATGALELYRATGEQRYLDDFGIYIAGRQSRPDGTIGVVDSFAQLGAADACGALGRPPIPAGPALNRSCALLAEDGRITVGQARSNAFGMPGFFNWGTTAQNGASGALAALATAAPGGSRRGCEVAAGARDYMLGRNPFGASFVVGYGAKPARHPHHWASVFGSGLPTGAVVGGPAPLSQIKSQDFHVSGPLQSSFAAYEDSRRDYVTSEPALDYAAASVLLLAALEARC
jgi:endoglucanase